MSAADRWWAAAIHGYVGGFGVEMMLSARRAGSLTIMCGLLGLGAFMCLWSMHALTTWAPAPDAGDPS